MKRILILALTLMLMLTTSICPASAATVTQTGNAEITFGSPGKATLTFTLSGFSVAPAVGVLVLNSRGYPLTPVTDFTVGSITKTSFVVNIKLISTGTITISWTAEGR